MSRSVRRRRSVAAAALALTAFSAAASAQALADQTRDTIGNLAQAPPAPPGKQPTPPGKVTTRIDVEGWEYLRRDSFQIYRCVSDRCNRSSAVSFVVHRANKITSIDDYRRQQAELGKAIQSKSPPGTKIEIIDVEEEKMGSIRLLKSTRRMSFPDGSQEFRINSIVLADIAISYISSSNDEAAAKANFQQFLPIVTLIVNLELKTQRPR